MKSKWNDQEASRFVRDPVAMRAYTSRLIGSDEDLVLHGGGNTSVKVTVDNLFGEKEEILYVKGSGWDLETIAVEGFAPVKLDVLKRMAQLERLSDTDMVKHQRAAMIDPKAPNPSVEAILHAIIPFQYVDHTHADAVVTLTNTSNGAQRIRDLYGERVLVVPYVMPGFVLARKVAQLTENIDWDSVDGMVLMNHGVFTFADNARQSYETMIRLVDEAEQYLHKYKAWSTAQANESQDTDPYALCKLRKIVSDTAGKAMISLLDDSPSALGFSALKNVEGIATRGPLTPDHVIHTKRVPLIVQDGVDKGIDIYARNYYDYFQQNKIDGLTCLDPAPRWAIWENRVSLANPSIKAT